MNVKIACNERNLNTYFKVFGYVHINYIEEIKFFDNFFRYNSFITGRGEVWSSRPLSRRRSRVRIPSSPQKLGQIAQSVEHLSEKQGVGSSILPLATNTYKGFFFTEL